MSDEEVVARRELDMGRACVRGDFASRMELSEGGFVGTELLFLRRI